ncbi:DNA-binding response regulator [Rhodococcus sp. 06-235-1A]|uniref:response regulator transcription factor n=1 Tax=Rhodococcus sp. 06-235-1A TaxID=2022508 RepID=UPI000B9C344C|nr:response regulator transcription factor [Rhodococcus sp. 06-235-1A]OZD07259.1 DNA-binding response regulator [Rhodococcus sp. 06-235-1A]
MKIVIAEDSVILRDGLAQLLIDRGYEVTATVGDAEALVAAVDEYVPDVAIIDVRMPPSFTDEGLVAAVHLRRRHPDVGVLVFSQWVETRYAAELLSGSSSGVGYLLKDRVADVGEFVDALVRVASGGTALDPEVVAQWVGSSAKRSTLDALTVREREVLDLMAQGLTNSALAAALHVSERAIEKHVGNIFGKLGLPPSDVNHRRVMAVLQYLGRPSGTAS